MCKCMYVWVGGWVGVLGRSTLLAFSEIEILVSQCFDLSKEHEAVPDHWHAIASWVAKAGNPKVIMH